MQQYNNILIGIAGGIGSGKSVISRILRIRGYSVYDCDSEARKLMELSSSLKDNICKIAGEKAYNISGRLNREYLADRIFSDSNIRYNINKYVHDAVKTDIENWRKFRRGILFVESALFNSSGLTTMMDEIWNVKTPLTTRVVRIKNRDKIAEEQIYQKIESQKNEETFPEDTTVRVIINNGKSSLILQMDKILNQLLENNKLRILC